WHGASFNFILWGTFHGLLLVCDKLFWSKLSLKFPSYFNIALTFTLVTLGWVLFRLPDIHSAMLFYQNLFDFSSLLQAPQIYRGAVINNRAMAMLLTAAILSFAPVETLGRAFRPIAKRFTYSISVGYGVAAITLVLLSSSFLIARGHTPFLYFRF
ncbi:MAG: hypothetical protein KDD53_01600, partial [Bdellovibrionales bacterium]|nr:hypothetical protein [Bdellovibrionales bacterium]